MLKLQEILKQVNNTEKETSFKDGNQEYQFFISNDFSNLRESFDSQIPEEYPSQEEILNNLMGRMDSNQLHNDALFCPEYDYPQTSIAQAVNLTPLRISPDKLEVTQNNVVKQSENIVVQTNHKLSDQKCNIFYFEVKLINTSDKYIQIGLSEVFSSDQIVKYPGCTRRSFGFRTDGKKVFFSKQESYGKMCRTDQTVGCLVNFAELKIQFTINGEMQGAAFDITKSLTRHLHSEKERMELISSLHPCVGLTTKDQKVKFNFGIYNRVKDVLKPKVESYICNPSNFEYDIATYEQDQYMNVANKVDDEKVESCEVDHLIKDYLYKNSQFQSQVQFDEQNIDSAELTTLLEDLSNDRVIVRKSDTIKKFSDNLAKTAEDQDDVMQEDEEFAAFQSQIFSDMHNNQQQELHSQVDQVDLHLSTIPINSDSNPDITNLDTIDMHQVITGSTTPLIGTQLDNSNTNNNPQNQQSRVLGQMHAVDQHDSTQNILQEPDCDREEIHQEDITGEESILQQRSIITPQEVEEKIEEDIVEEKEEQQNEKMEDVHDYEVSQDVTQNNNIQHEYHIQNIMNPVSLNESLQENHYNEIKDQFNQISTHNLNLIHKNDKENDKERNEQILNNNTEIIMNENPIVVSVSNNENDKATPKSRTPANQTPLDIFNLNPFESRDCSEEQNIKSKPSIPETTEKSLESNYDQIQKQIEHEITQNNETVKSIIKDIMIGVQTKVDTEIKQIDEHKNNILILQAKSKIKESLKLFKYDDALYQVNALVKLAPEFEQVNDPSKGRFKFIIAFLKFLKCIELNDCHSALKIIKEDLETSKFPARIPLVLQQLGRQQQVELTLANLMQIMANDKHSLKALMLKQETLNEVVGSVFEMEVSLEQDPAEAVALNPQSDLEMMIKHLNMLNKFKYTISGSLGCYNQLKI